MMFIEGQRLVEKADPDLGLDQGSAAVPNQPAPNQPSKATTGSNRRSGGRKR